MVPKKSFTVLCRFSLQRSFILRVLKDFIKLLNRQVKPDYIVVKNTFYPDFRYRLDRLCIKRSNFIKPLDHCTVLCCQKKKKKLCRFPLQTGFVLAGLFLLHQTVVQTGEVKHISTQPKKLISFHFMQVFVIQRFLLKRYNKFYLPVRDRLAKLTSMLPKISFFILCRFPSYIDFVLRGLTLYFIKLLNRQVKPDSAMLIFFFNADFHYRRDFLLSQKKVIFFVLCNFL